MTKVDPVVGGKPEDWAIKHADNDLQQVGCKTLSTILIQNVAITVACAALSERRALELAISLDGFRLLLTFGSSSFDSRAQKGLGTHLCPRGPVPQEN